MTSVKLLAKIELEKLNLFINQRYGLEFRHKRIELLQEAVQKRLKLCKIATVAEYLKLVQEREDEALRLINLLTVHETYFFREPSHLDVMSLEVIPRLVRNGGEHPFIRLLSAGCSTGEEAYSMAISILKIPGAGINWDFEVIGIDVDNEAIEKAKTGLYGLYSFRSCPKEIWDNYFDAVSKESFRVKDFVKDKVRFESLNLFEEIYPRWTENMDIVFYRNVSIYFSKEQRAEVFRRLAALLNPNGNLFLSCTETLDHNNNMMSLVKNGEAFYYKKQDDVSLAEEFVRKIKIINKPYIPIDKPKQKIIPKVPKVVPNIVPRKVFSNLINTEPNVFIDTKASQCQQIFAAALKLIKLKNYDEAIINLDKIIELDSLFIKAYTLKANILLNQENLAPAIELCQQVLLMDTFCLEAYLLLGMAAKFAGKNEKAIQRFKEAMYVDPECWLAHFFLAEVYKILEKDKYAKREYEVAMRILQHGNFEKHGLSFFLVPFQVDDFIKLCQHNIINLKN